MREEVVETIRGILKGERLAVLATSAAGHPYTTLVAFAESADLRSILFATHRSTRKFANLGGDERVSLLMDNRTNSSSDFRSAAAVTAIGTAREVPPGEREQRLQLYLSKHPGLEEFATSPGCALFTVAVRRYGIVTRFQDVVELRVDEDLPAP